MTKSVILLYNAEKHSFAFPFWNIICFLNSLSCCFQLEQQRANKNVVANYIDCIVWF